MTVHTTSVHLVVRRFTPRHTALFVRATARLSLCGIPEPHATSRTNAYEPASVCLRLTSLNFLHLFRVATSNGGHRLPSCLLPPVNHPSVKISACEDAGTRRARIRRRISRRKFKVPKNSLLPPIDEPEDEKVGEGAAAYVRVACTCLKGISGYLHVCRRISLPHTYAVDRTDFRRNTSIEGKLSRGGLLWDRPVVVERW